MTGGSYENRSAGGGNNNNNNNNSNNNNNNYNVSVVDDFQNDGRE